jgi:predicted phage baseplate assembly protein
MTRLAPNLFQRRFADLMEIGRARIPALAPAWTDHNSHDPGITLMELLAWVAEAQLYSLSHVRRDERAAYAALLGISSTGTRSATGLIWSDRQDPDSPAAKFQKTQVIPQDSAIYVVNTDEPVFTPVHKLLWAPGRIDRLESRRPRGRGADLTTANERSATPFLPFGEKAGPRSVLALTFVCRDKAGLFGSDRENARGAYWLIGVRVAPPLGNPAPTEPASESKRSPLIATLVVDGKRSDLKIAADTTQGFLATGVVLLNLDDVNTSPTEFTIEFRSPGGFPRPPRVIRIEPNVIPIQQGRTVHQELHAANGMPDFNFALGAPGLKFAAGKEPVTVQVQEGSVLETWQRCDRLSAQGPEDKVYEFDFRADEITFGNGVNGKQPAAEAQVLVTYKVSEGDAGGVARNRKWHVTGFEGTFGVNPDPVAGGAAASDFIKQRRDARARSRSEHALLSSSDIEAAAKSLSLLEIARAWVVQPGDTAPRTGVVTLVAMRTRPDETEPATPPETPRWLAAIRRQLLPRIPLCTRLAVSAPNYRDFIIQTVVEAYPGLDPETVKKAVHNELKVRLALIGPGARLPGVPVTRRDVAAWLRGISGVRRILQLQLAYADGKTATGVKVLHSGSPLPRVPVGTRLIVSAPNIPNLTVEAEIRVYQGRKSETVKKAVEDELRNQLAGIDPTSRQQRIPVSGREVEMWIRGVDAVRCVVALHLVYAISSTVDTIKVLRSGLPRWRDGESTIEVKHAAPGGSQ